MTPQDLVDFFKKKGREKSPAIAQGNANNPAAKPRTGGERRYMKAIKRGNKLIIDPKEYKAGMKEELEHLDVTGGSSIATQKIVMAHLREDPKYYTKLKKAMK